jgi:hypothetical protein
MKPDAVRNLVGEPERSVQREPADPFPETWPGLQMSPEPMGGGAVEEWVYSDEVVDPAGVTITVVLALPLAMLAPFVLLDDAITGEPTTPLWIRRRMIRLYFEDGRLERWSFEHENEFMEAAASAGSGPGPPMGSGFGPSWSHSPHVGTPPARIGVPGKPGC